MNILCSIIQREHTVRSINWKCVFSGIRKYQLSKILPSDAMEDVFLGFSACGHFLISYRKLTNAITLRFWVFPPADRTVLQLFSEASFFRMPYAMDDVIAIRFIQSLAEPSLFFLVFCDVNGIGSVTAFGSMPNLDCRDCRHFALQSPSRTPSASQFATCRIHMQIVKVHMDLPAPMGESFIEESDEKPARGGGFSKHGHNNSRLLDWQLPPCIRALTAQHVMTDRFDSATPGNPSSQPSDVDECACFALTGLSIANIHASICPVSGLLRIAWPSPDNQIKVLSCSFEQLSSKPTYSAYMFPQGTANTFDQKTPLAYNAPLLTQNCCSTCYAWLPISDDPCAPAQTQPVPYTCKSSSSFKSRCVFSRESKPPSIKQENSSINVQCACDVSQWPDGHNIVSEALVSRQSSPSAQSSRTGDGHSTDEASMDSSGCVRSPEDLVAHRLSGLCHTSFDTNSWLEFVDPRCNAVTSNNENQNPCDNLCHLEEVVFDIPNEIFQLDQAKDIRLAIFIPPDEPDLMLVYQISQNSRSNQTPIWLDAIDLSTGQRASQKPIKHWGYLQSLMPNMDIRVCPHSIPNEPPDREKLVHELNNLEMITRLESIDQFEDPGGGYVVYR